MLSSPETPGISPETPGFEHSGRNSGYRPGNSGKYCPGYSGYIPGYSGFLVSNLNGGKCKVRFISFIFSRLNVYYVFLVVLDKVIFVVYKCIVGVRRILKI